MNRHIHRPPKTSEADLDLLKDLERQSIEEIQKLRAHERLDVRTEIKIRSGNVSQAMEPTIVGTTSDVSAGGCGAISQAPLLVGDVYQLEFDREKLDVPVVFARCVRCRMLRENAFEIALAFFSQITINDSKEPGSKHLLS